MQGFQAGIEPKEKKWVSDSYHLMRPKQRKNQLQFYGICIELTAAFNGCNFHFDMNQRQQTHFTILARASNKITDIDIAKMIIIIFNINTMTPW